jgi:NAD-dependent SIR2 family protein deacetylase
MARLKCSKCGNVFELENRIRAELQGGLVHLGPYKLLKCPACGKRSFFNVYSSVKNPVTWSKEEKTALQAEPQLSDEELEKKLIEESKYEKS